MKEIDLLPEWYKNSKRRQAGYRTQYVALGGLLVVMVVWNFIAVHSVSKTEKELGQLELKQAQMESVSKEAGLVKSDLSRLRKKADIIEKIDSKINVANILGEISFLLDDNIILTQLSFEAERFASEEQGINKRSSAVRLARSKAGVETAFFGDVRFKVVFRGIAAQAGDVAELICKLEDSAYFFQVIPSFSRNRLLGAKGSDSAGGYQVSEFEIGCYLANYQLEETFFADAGKAKNQKR